MLVANKPMSIGRFTVEAGERITREMQLELPPGRLPVLIEHRMIEEVVDEVADSRQIDELAFKVEKLETAVAALQAALSGRTARAKGGE